MDDRLRRLLLILGVGALWAIMWPTIGMVIMLVLTVVLGPNGDVGPLEMALILGRVGFPAGIVFGALATTLEPPRAIADVPLVRVLLYGVIAAATTGILAGLQPSAIVDACVLGGVSGPATIAVGRAHDGRRQLRV